MEKCFSNAQREATSALAEISNQETKYKWNSNPKKARIGRKNIKQNRHNTIQQDSNSKKLRFPSVLNRNSSQQEQQFAFFKEKQQKKDSLLPKVANSNAPCCLSKVACTLQHDSCKSEQQQYDQTKLDWEAVKALIISKRLKCQSLNNVLVKFKEKSKRKNSFVFKGPFRIKGYI